MAIVGVVHPGAMREIAVTFEAAGQPDGFHLGAAEVFAAATASR